MLCDVAVGVREEGVGRSLSVIDERRTQLGTSRFLTHASVLTDPAPFFTSEGTEPSFLDQNQTLMKLLFRSTTYLELILDHINVLEADSIPAAAVVVEGGAVTLCRVQPHTTSCVSVDSGIAVELSGCSESLF